MALCIGWTILILLSYLGHDLLATDATEVFTGFLARQASPAMVNDEQGFYFLKVHKTGSSTFANILLRFGIHRNLTFAIFHHSQPYPTYNMLDYLIPHPLDLIENTHYRHKLNIVNVHSVFNKTAIDIFMPRDTHLIATVRHPFAQLQSAFNHYHLEKHLKIPHNTSDPVKIFLQNPSKYDRLLPGSLYNKISAITGIKLSYTRNRMAFEFGFDITQLENATYISKHLQHVEKSFDIVIMTEYYDESLLLLKKRFSWEYKDIVYIILKNKSYEGKHKSPDSYGQLYKNYKNWAPLDYLIYDHFLKIHRQNVLLQGPEFRKEVVYFQMILSEVQKFCTGVGSSKRLRKKSLNHLVVAGSAYHGEFTVSAADCEIMMTSINLKLTINHQYREYCATDPRYMPEKLCGAKAQPV